MVDKEKITAVIQDKAQEAPNESVNDSNEDGGEEGEDEMEQQYEQSDDSGEGSVEDEQTYNSVPKRVRQNLATIRIQQPAGDDTIVFSYHYKYEKYLRDHNLIDVSIIISINYLMIEIYYSLKKQN